MPVYLLLAVTACHPQRPAFIQRVVEDCGRGDAWACGLIDAVQNASQEQRRQDRVEQDVREILRGMQRSPAPPLRMNDLPRLGAA